MALWPALGVLLVGLAGYAALRDLAAGRALRSRRRRVVVAVGVGCTLVALWATGLVLLVAVPDRLAVILRVLVVVPFVPVGALAALGYLLRHDHAARQERPDEAGTGRS